MPSIFTIWQRSLCAVTGALSGGIAGSFFGLFQAASAAALTSHEVIQMGILLALIAWACILVIIGLWLHFGVRAIALPALLTAVLVSIVTVAIANRVHIPFLAVWIGLLVGTIIGALLCRLCGVRYAIGGDSHGVR